MKRILFLFLVFLSISVAAQEPGNNLRKTVRELRTTFQDLVSWGSQGDIIYYKSVESEILFGTKNGIVISEFALFEGEDGYLRKLYESLCSSFLKYNNRHLWGDNNRSLHLFYSYFTVTIFYNPYEKVSIMYDLDRRYWP